MLKLGPDPKIIQWVCSRLKVNDFGKCQVIAWESDGKIAGASIFNNYASDNIELTVVWDDRKKINRTYIKAVFRYCFNQLKVHRITARVNESNVHSLKMTEKLGFKLEGRLREFDRGNDVLIFGMLINECRWL